MNFCYFLVYRTILSVILFVPFTFAVAQDMSQDTTCVQLDLTDELRSAMNKPPKIKSEKSSSFIAFPIIGSNPATGFMVGLGGQYAFKMPERRLTSIYLNRSNPAMVWV
jgi:hypothetical protein